MIPTMKLRWIWREDYDPTFPPVQVLQQWWEEAHYRQAHLEDPPGEWRDVPTEKEE